MIETSAGAATKEQAMNATAAELANITALAGILKDQGGEVTAETVAAALATLGQMHTKAIEILSIDTEDGTRRNEFMRALAPEIHAALVA